MNIFVLILNPALVVKPTNPGSYTSCPCKVYSVWGGRGVRTGFYFVSKFYCRLAYDKL